MISSNLDQQFKRSISNVELPKETVVHNLSKIATMGTLQNKAAFPRDTIKHAFISFDYLVGSSFAVMDFERYFGSWQDQRVELSYKKMTEKSLSEEESILLETLNKRLNKNVKAVLPEFMAKADVASNFIEAYLAKK